MIRPLLITTAWLVLLTGGWPGQLTAAPASADTALFSSDGYRIDRYRSPTPQTAASARTIGPQELQALRRSAPAPLVIDVINLEFRAGRFLLTEPHASVPGAIWLPNTGKGDLDESWRDYLLDNVRARTAGRRDHPVVVLCKSDCWLSWNATRRLAEAGYSQLYWLRDGIDSWQNAGHPSVIIEPVPPQFTHDNN